MEASEILEDVDTDTLKRLERAWKCIKSSFLNKSAQTSLEEGPGMNVYIFLRPSTGHNCEYYYATKDSSLWTMMLNTEKISLKKYDHKNNYMIAVSVPLHDSGDESINQIRIFDRATDLQVE